MGKVIAKRQGVCPTNLLEEEAYAQGYLLVAGVDEAGRGALAGPVVAAAVILPRNYQDAMIQDSKKLSQRQRETCANSILKLATAVGVGVVEPATIDEINILQATLLAMDQAVAALAKSPDFIIVDGKQTIKIPLPQRAVIGGDAKSISCAAASIIAKTTRDAIMRSYHSQFPQYALADNKGYGTAKHLCAIAAFGQTPIHRRTFHPKALANNVQQKLGFI